MFSWTLPRSDPCITLPDANDRHVLAAAIRSNSSVIVTYNLKDFPKETLNKYGIEAQHPDDFLMHLLDLSFEMVCLAVKRHRESLRNPSKTIQEYLVTLTKQSLDNLVNKLKEFSDLL